MNDEHGRYGNDPFADDDQVQDDPFAADSPASEDPFAHPDDHVPVDPATGEVDEEAPSLEDRVKDLEETVAEISELLALTPGGPWVWHLLEPEARRQLATDLVEWVRWFSDRYLAHLSEETVLKLPPRWFTHPVVVELLTALYVAYISVYSGRRRTPSFGLVEWHERCLWPTIDRLKTLKLVDRNGRLSEHTHVVTTDADAVDHLVVDLLEHDAPPSDPGTRARATPSHEMS